MLDKLLQSQERIMKVIGEEVLGWMDALLQDSLKPEAFLSFTVGMGIDLSRIPDMVGRSGGFDPYRVLGIEKTATDAEVRKRYRELLVKLHPDTAGIRGTDFLLQMMIAAYRQIEKERGW
jgi:DnaJ-domain-containing protein 1